MKLENNERLSKRLTLLIGKFFKIVPLFEEGNKGLETYVSSLSLKMIAMDDVIKIKHTEEYMSILENLNIVLKELNKEEEERNHTIVKRHAFESLNLLKKMIDLIEEDEAHG